MSIIQKSEHAENAESRDDFEGSNSSLKFMKTRKLMNKLFYVKLTMLFHLLFFCVRNQFLSTLLKQIKVRKLRSQDAKLIRKA